MVMNSTRKLTGWDISLSREIEVKGGRGSLKTLREAGVFLDEHFGTVTQSAALENALAALVKAAERGAPHDKELATRAVEAVLWGRGWL
jgi:hypothetical protein